MRSKPLKLSNLHKNANVLASADFSIIIVFNTSPEIKDIYLTYICYCEEYHCMPRWSNW